MSVNPVIENCIYIKNAIVLRATMVIRHRTERDIVMKRIHTGNRDLINSLTFYR